jgi:uncharacterized protein (TIGR04255 family)
MTEPLFRLRNAPIIEAIVDVDCDMPAKYSLSDMEASALGAYKEFYPKIRKQFVQEVRVETKPNAAPVQSSIQGLQALRFLQSDDKQLVQVRANGFSFNRLAPYGGLDDYLAEIERTWKIFIGLVCISRCRRYFFS